MNTYDPTATCAIEPDLYSKNVVPLVFRDNSRLTGDNRWYGLFVPCF